MSAFDKTAVRDNRWSSYKENRRWAVELVAVYTMMADINEMESWNAERKLTSFCSLFCWKIGQKNIYLTKNCVYKKPLFSEYSAWEPAID